MQAKIAVIVSLDGIESISLLPGEQGHEISESSQLCTYLDSEISEFDEAIRRKLEEMYIEGDESIQ